MSAALNVVGLRGDLPEPPVPADCDLTGFRDMKLDVPKLMQSKAWTVYAERQPELGFYMVNLWAQGWQQKPAGSLENDDEMLCRWARCSPDKWPEVRAKVLHGWELHSDGLLYHGFLCEKVKEAWAKRLKWRARAKAGGDAKAAAEKAAREAAAASSTAQACQGKGEGEGKEGKEDSGAPPRPGREGPGIPPAPTPREVLDTEGRDKLVQMTRRTEAGADSLIGSLMKDAGDDAVSVLRVIQNAHRHWVAKKPKFEPVSWIKAGVKADADARRRQAAPQARGPRKVDDDIAFFAGISGADAAWQDERPFLDGEACTVEG